MQPTPPARFTQVGTGRLRAYATCQRITVAGVVVEFDFNSYHLQIIGKAFNLLYLRRYLLLHYNRLTRHYAQNCQVQLATTEILEVVRNWLTD